MGYWLPIDKNHKIEVHRNPCGIRFLLESQPEFDYWPHPH